VPANREQRGATRVAYDLVQEIAMIHFSESDWQRCEADYRAFWAGELDRPLVPLWVDGLDPGRPASRRQLKGFIPQMGEEARAEEVVDAWDHQLSGREYLGDAFPMHWPNFGPGALAVPVGGLAGVGANTVWFHGDRPYTSDDLDDLDLALDPENPWLRRIAAIMRAAGERWGSQVQLGMTDIGGVYDVLSSFLPGQELLLALYDDPDAVKRAARRIETAWWRMWELLEAELRPFQRGWTDWGGMWTPASTYMFQCDFSYMISPEMFGEFILPELARSFTRVELPCYHLDGPGELAHLDQLLADPNLRLIQWVPGDGQPGAHEWHEVFRRILDAGKLAQVTCVGNCKESRWEQIERLLDRLGSGKGLHVMVSCCGLDQRDEALAYLERIGVPVGAAVA
jgi:hypothetical protein